MLVSPQSKISYNRNKQFKYKEAPPSPKAQKSTEAPDNATEPFRLNSHQKAIFNNDYKTYFDADLKKKGSEKKLADGFTHEGPFKPCCRSKGTPFTPLVYIEDSKGNKKAVKVQKTENKGDAFK